MAHDSPKIENPRIGDNDRFRRLRAWIVGRRRAGQHKLIRSIGHIGDTDISFGVDRTWVGFARRTLADDRLDACPVGRARENLLACGWPKYILCGSGDARGRAAARAIAARTISTRAIAARAIAPRTAAAGAAPTGAAAGAAAVITGLVTAAGQSPEGEQRKDKIREKDSHKCSLNDR